MKLITKELTSKIPAIGKTQNQEDPIIWIKLFHPCSSWTWYVIEFDPKEELCYGLVDGFEKELGYFSLAELREVTVRGLGIERDLCWQPRRLSEVKNGC